MKNVPIKKLRVLLADDHDLVRRGFCREYLSNRHEIEIVDVLREPKRAMADGIFMTPTLIKLLPHPLRRMIGTLSQTQLMQETLGLEVPPA